MNIFLEEIGKIEADDEQKKDVPLTREEVAEFVSKNFLKTKDRLKAVLNHLRKSSYFDKDSDPRSKNYILDMARVMDNECIKRIEQRPYCWIFRKACISWEWNICDY